MSSPPQLVTQGRQHRPRAVPSASACTVWSPAGCARDQLGDPHRLVAATLRPHAHLRRHGGRLQRHDILFRPGCPANPQHCGAWNRLGSRVSTRWSTEPPTARQPPARPVTLGSATSPRTAAGSSPSTAPPYATDRDSADAGPAGCAATCSTRRCSPAATAGGRNWPVGWLRRPVRVRGRRPWDVRHHDSPGRPGDDPRYPPGSRHDQGRGPYTSATCRAHVSTGTAPR